MYIRAGPGPRRGASSGHRASRRQARQHHGRARRSRGGGRLRARRRGSASRSRRREQQLAVPATGPSALTEVGAVVGTRGYLAPEVRHGAMATAAADQYALCVAILEARSGARRARAAPERVLAVVRRGLAARPGPQRFRDLDALLDALERATLGDPRRARRGGRARRRCDRRRTLRGHGDARADPRSSPRRRVGEATRAANRRRHASIACGRCGVSLEAAQFEHRARPSSARCRRAAGRRRLARAGPRADARAAISTRRSARTTARRVRRGVRARDRAHEDARRVRGRAAPGEQRRCVPVARRRGRVDGAGARRCCPQRASRAVPRAACCRSLRELLRERGELEASLATALRCARAARRAR